MYVAASPFMKGVVIFSGKYDRAIQILTQKPLSAGGKINWTPNMIEKIRLNEFWILAHLLDLKRKKPSNISSCSTLMLIYLKNAESFDTALY